jgi:hypothetical protein
MAVLTSDQLRNIGIGQTITVKATGKEAYTVRTLANRLKTVDALDDKGIVMKVHYDKCTGNVSVTKEQQ